jgi:pyridoxine 5-phosphate synthase
MKTVRLGVNIDHIATIRQARRAQEPDPVAAAVIAELAGADGITVHLRGDRRHIQDSDLVRLRETVTTRLNLEMAPNEAMLQTALDHRPNTATLVPENVGEITTQGGLDLFATGNDLSACIERLQEAGIDVSLFIDPAEEQVRRAIELKVKIVELNTAAYAEAVPKGLDVRNQGFRKELDRIVRAAQIGSANGLAVYAGHGLTYRNISPLAALPELEEFNIGHNIVARAVLVGLDRAVREMLDLLRNPKS